MKYLYTKALLIISMIILIQCKKQPKNNQVITVVQKDSIQIKKDTIVSKHSPIKIYPIEHASMILEYKEQVIYIDPTGGKESYESYPKPTMVLITDIHGDHMHIDTLEELEIKGTPLIVPAAVAEKLPAHFTKQLVILNNGETKNVNDINIEAIPMYNLRKEALKFHAKGRGNGYVITLGDERIYVSGDTEDIPEMRNLRNIDKAFVCMNLPYTMTVEKAAEAVISFNPKTVYPYHYRGTNGLSDVENFKNLVNNASPSIEVIQLNWYPK